TRHARVGDDSVHDGGRPPGPCPDGADDRGASQATTAGAHGPEGDLGGRLLPGDLLRGVGEPEPAVESARAGRVVGIDVKPRLGETALGPDRGEGRGEDRVAETLS